MSPATRTRLAVLAALMLAAVPARAADDAGTRSVFASGEGVRALAMGSAFVAAADDASAMVWNPAGLGLARRAEFQVAQANDLGLGFRQTYAALALPSWRLGAAGLAFRSFGVSGIEERDTRNVLVGELSDSEFEIALGYGRAFGAGATLGAAVKLQRQSIAGYGAAGLGADLGVRVLPGRLAGSSARWAERWSWGLAVRNLVEPSLRLDRESVPDPMTVRTGMAWTAPTPGAGAMVAEVDLEAPRGADPRVHAGVEYRVIPALALRGGTDGDRLTAGAGLRWRDLSVDYAYRDNPIATEHRVGIAVAFGASVEQSRTAARVREDEVLQRRLTDAFRERQERQVAGLLESARAARAQGDLDGALQTLGVIRTLAPEDASASALESACLRDRAAALERAGDLAGALVGYDMVLASAPGDTAATAAIARCRAESDRRTRRTQELRERFTAAMDAFAAGDLARARHGFEAVVRGAPADTEAVRMLERTGRAIAIRVADRLADAERELRAGRLAEAGALLDQAGALDPAAARLSSLRTALARARANEAVAGAPRPASRPEAAARPSLSERELDLLYRQGRQAYDRGQSDAAVHYWELVWSARPDYREVRESLKREYLTRGMESFAAGRLEEAVSLWEKALRVDPNDARARGYLSRAQQQMARSREILGMNR